MVGGQIHVKPIRGGGYRPRVGDRRVLYTLNSGESILTVEADGRGRRNPGKRLPGASWPGRAPCPGAGAQQCTGCGWAVAAGAADLALNGEARWRAAEVMAPVGPGLAPYQPPRRCFVVDERHVGAEDLPGANLMKAVPGLEQSHTPGDLVRVAGRPVEWLRDPRMTRG